MKKILLLPLLLLPFLSFSQETINKVSEEVLMDSVPLEQFTLYADSLKNVLDKINNFSDIPGRAGEIIHFYPKIKDGMVTFVKQVRKPDSAEDINFLVMLISDYAKVIAPLLLYILTFFYRLFKKNAANIVAASEKVTNFMRTRYFVVILGVVLTGLWAVFFREGTGIWEIFSFLVGTVLKGVGFATIIQWIGEAVMKILGKNKEAVKV